MRFAQNLGIQSNGAPQPDTLNAERHPAFSENLRQSVARIAFTGVLSDSYYGKEDQQTSEFIPLCRKMAVTDPHFLINAARASREANFKLFPKIAVAALISECRGEKFTMVEDAVIRLLSTYSAGQLLELALVFKSGLMGGKLGSRAQKIMSAALLRKNDEAWENMTLSDREDVRRLLRLLHPRLSPTTANIARYALGDKPVPYTGRQSAVEQLKGGFWDQAKVIRDFNLPFNVTKGFANKDMETWKAIRDNMSALQLMINMKALAERGVLSPGELRSRLAVAKMGRMVPHDILRPLAATQMMSRGREFYEVLVDFLAELAAVPLTTVAEARVAVALDFSGSMAPGYNGNYLGTWLLAVTLATPIMAAYPDRELIYFGNEAVFEGEMLRGHQMPHLKNCTPSSAFHNLLRLQPSQGTNIASPIDLLFRDEKEVDVLFLFTDEQQNLGSMPAAWKMYRKRYPKAKLVVINVSNTKWHLAYEGDPSISIIQSITPLVFRQFSNFNKSLVDMIAEWHTGKL